MNRGKKLNLNWYCILPIILNKLLQRANTLCTYLRPGGHMNVYLDILHVFLNSFLHNLKNIRNFGMKFGGSVDWLCVILIEFRVWFYTVWFIEYFFVELRYSLFEFDTFTLYIVNTNPSDIIAYVWYQDFWPCDLDLELRHSFEKLNPELYLLNQMY